MIEGSLVALVTPFRNDEIDEDALRNMVRWQIEQGADGIVPMGTTGESATLDAKEHSRVTEIVVEETAARIRNDKVTPPLVGMALLFMALIIYPALNLH